MAVIRWNPAREVDVLHREMSRLFDDVFAPSQPLKASAGYTPVAELEEMDDIYQLRLELPGISKDELDIQVTADSVAISGEHKMASKGEECSNLRSEFRYGSFQRVLATPGRINHQNVTADYQDGILTLTLPKAEEEKNKVVKVNLG
ncbi:MAG: Hsp20/alpha crystallin family protein [Cyanobacteria bacterium P01_F01_bin.150]